MDLFADEKQNKLTYVSVLGLENALEMEKNLTIAAKSALSVFGPAAHTLQDLADFIIQRDY